MNHYSSLHRYASEAVGTFILAGFAILVIALYQGGRINEWLNPGLTVKIILPRAGLGGLAEGADVEVLGTPAGEVINIVIDPDKKMHANVHIIDSMAPFITRDSQVFIRKRFGVAGEAFLEISSGEGQPLDDSYAVLIAQTDEAPIASVEALLTEIKDKVLPLVDNIALTAQAMAQVAGGLRDPQGELQQTLVNINTISGRVASGEGALGRLLVEATLIEELEELIAQLGTTVTGVNKTIDGVAPALEQLQVTAVGIAKLSSALGAQSSALPRVTARAESILATLEDVLHDLKRTTPQLPRITTAVADTTENLPLLTIQTQQTIAELELLLQDLRTSWLLGGSSGNGQPLPATTRVAPLEVRP